MRTTSARASVQRTNRRNRALVAAAMATASLACVGNAVASQGLASTTWIGASDTWYNPANWSLGALPMLTDDAFIDNGSTVTINDPAQTATVNILSIGESTGFSGALVVSDGTLTAVTDLRVGGNSNVPGVPGVPPVAGQGGGLGTLTQSGGVINVNGALNVGVGGATTVFGGSTGYYYMNGGVLNDGTATSNFLLVGNGSLVVGNVIQTAGTVNSTGSIIIGRNAGTGSWTLGGGTVSITNDLALGSVGAGTFIQNDGTVTMTNVPVAPGSTTYTTANINIGAGAVTSIGLYQMNGGTLLVNKDPNATTFVSSINSSIVVGNSGTGVFNQTGGLVQVANLIQIGRNSGAGTYIMGGGTLSAGSFDVGNVGNGTFVQTAGKVTAGSITVGRSSQGIGTMLLNGGNLTTTGDIIIGGVSGGASGSGTLNVGNVPLVIGGNLNIGFGGASGAPTTARGTGMLSLGTISFSAANAIMAIGNGTGAFGQFTNSAGVISTTGVINLGRTNATASGTFTNSGTVSCTSLLLSPGTGTYTQSAGSTTASIFNINGLMQFSGGTASLGSGTIGSNSTLRTSIPLNINSGSFGNATIQVDDPNSTVTFGTLMHFPAARTLTKTGPGALVVNGNYTFAGSPSAGTITTSAGLTELNSNGTSLLSLNANGGVTNIKAQQTINRLSIGAGGTATMKATDGTTHGVTTFTIAGNAVPTGTLDIGKNNLVINYTAGNSPFANVKAQVISGFNNGNFNGPGVRSSSASFSGAHPTAVGYAEASAVGLTSGFGGVTTDADTVIVRYTLDGDANLDGQVDSLDFKALANNFNQSSGGVWSGGDFNYDGVVNALDFNALSTNYAAALPAPGLGALVPEPVSAAILAAVGTCSIRRRR